MEDVPVVMPRVYRSGRGEGRGFGDELDPKPTDSNPWACLPVLEDRLGAEDEAPLGDEVVGLDVDLAGHGLDVDDG